MNILITGATGLIGYHLVKKLLDSDNAIVYAAGRSMRKLQETFSEYIENPRLHLFDYMEMLNSIGHIVHFDSIFHLAGPTSPDDIHNRPIDVITPNVIDLNIILRHAAQEAEIGHRCRVIVASSVTIYQNTTDTDKVFREEDSENTTKAGNPIFCYPESKRFAEMLSLSYNKQFGVDVVIVRIGYVYGYAKNIPHTTLYDFIKSALDRKRIVIQNASLPKRDNIYVEDAICALLLISQKAESGNIINISSKGEKGNFASLDEMANIIMEAECGNTNAIADLLIIPEIKKRQPGCCVDNKKLSNLGWQLEYSLKEGLQKTINEIKRH